MAIPIHLFKFPATLDEVFDAVGASEATAVSTITYYLEEEAKEFHKEQISDVDNDLGGEPQPDNSRSTFPFVVDSLIRRFLTNYVLKSTQDEVSSSVQNPV